MRLAVIDAGIALSWVLPDETTAQPAAEVLAAFRAGEVRLLAPSRWEYEVGNVLRLAVTRGRIGEIDGAEALRSLLELGVDLAPFAPLAEPAWELSLAHQLTIYDAAYLALAQENACPLYTLDRQLIAAAEKIGLTGGR